MTPNEFGKLPPQAIELEEAIIGACMLERNAYDKIANIINSPEVFYKESHQIIYKGIIDMKVAGEQVDMLTVMEWHKQKGTLEDIGGPVYISQLTTKIASAAHIEYHALILRQKYVQREVIRTAAELQNAAYNEDYDELMSMYSLVTTNIDDLIAGKSSMRHVRDIAFDSVKAIEERAKKAKEGGITGIPTGINQLDSITNGLQGGQLIVLASRPAMGKTAIALNAFTKFAAVGGNAINYFSLEMTDISLYDRLVLSWGGVSKDHYKRGQLTHEEWDLLNQAQSDLRSLPIWIDDNHNINVNYIRSVVRSKARKGECKMVVVDYLQLIDSIGDSKYQTREREVAIISRELKMMAKELNIPVVLLCQLNRSVESRAGLDGKAPRLSDLRESGAIEQDADIVIMPWRPEYYGYEEDSEGNDLTNVILMEITKHRDGETGRVLAYKNKEFTVIGDNNDNNPF